MSRDESTAVSAGGAVLRERRISSLFLACRFCRDGGEGGVECVDSTPTRRRSRVVPSGAPLSALAARSSRAGCGDGGASLARRGHHAGAPRRGPRGRDGERGGLGGGADPRQSRGAQSAGPVLPGEPSAAGGGDLRGAQHRTGRRAVGPSQLRQRGGGDAQHAGREEEREGPGAEHPGRTLPRAAVSAAALRGETSGVCGGGRAAHTGCTPRRLPPDEHHGHRRESGHLCLPEQLYRRYDRVSQDLAGDPEEGRATLFREGGRVCVWCARYF